MAKTLIICGHPDYKESVANRAILEEVKKLFPGAEIVILSELYPDFKIDVELEQKRLADVETLVFEYPIQWFDAPSLMHRYVEQVFTHGFAYGRTGTALKGKKLILSFTVGGKKKVYDEGEHAGFTMNSFMSPMLATAPYVNMDYKDAVISYDMLPNPTDKEAMEDMIKRARDHGKRLAEMLVQAR